MEIKKYLYPIIFIEQSPAGVLLNVNGIYDGYTEIRYYYENNVNDTITIELTEETILINDFPQGSGNYSFYLAAENEKSKEFTYYVNVSETITEFYQRILSYVKNPVDAEYMEEKFNIADTIISGNYLERIIEVYNNIKNKQDYEKQSFYQFGQILEKFENYLSISCNKEALEDTDLKIKYGPNITITATDRITCVAVYKKINNKYKLEKQFSLVFGGTVKIDFEPEHFYKICLTSAGEPLLYIKHYQFEEESNVFYWSVDEETDYDNQNIIEDTQLSTLTFDVSYENKVRIIDEKNQQNQNYFITRPEVYSGDLNAYKLFIKIPEYDLLAAAEKNFYINIKEKDELEDISWSRTFLVTGEITELNAEEYHLDDELVINIEDEKHNKVSNFVRYGINEDLSSYEILKEQIECNNFVVTLLQAVKKAYGNDFMLKKMNQITYELLQEDLNEKELYRKILAAIANDNQLASGKDRLIYITANLWQSRFSVNPNYFSENNPIFYYSENRLTFPVSENGYLLIDEYTDYNGEVGYKCQSSSELVSTDFKIHDHALHIIYAIDKTDYSRSGFILVSHLNGDNIYTNNITAEVIRYE